ncbi:MAG: cellulase family glycosylhydrolase [Bacteroidota bacterium]|nr:cellulase family glycosylhydrolase [Bacteroidota bacterium]
MKCGIYLKILLCCSLLLCNRLHSQKKSKNSNLVFVDKQGVLRWTKDKTEASFFGVNYTVPFAYGYRSHKALGKDIKKAIEEDIYHLSRLGLDAFRVHIWDTEISDSLGNLLVNEHLDLFDYLLQQLELRNIKIIITPIAFWGNGYPERDEKTIGFSSVYGKDQSVVKEVAIKAQENYLQQILNHQNPYTKSAYKDDPNIIAVEINNEPHHSGPKEKTTEYVNRLAAAIRSTGWTKPVFYNISESPWYSDAIAKANVEGHSFQWYPTGLVAGHEQKGNFLPNVDQYIIPFDSIPAFRTKAKMVYEFDAADILQSCMYPAIARTYRKAGFQWCTQFAYDPMATAYANTEYQTHYLNLAYTPSKAISLLIASKVFHRIPRLKNYGTYPSDTLFDVFRVSYKNSLSEMNSGEEFYYSNSTNTKPVNISKLNHIAGVGNSPVVQYGGTGAYFLDKLADGKWRLEVMPDVIHIRDPFERASPKKEVTRIQWEKQKMQISIPDLGANFSVQLLNDGSHNATPGRINRDGSNEFDISPGAYLLTAKEVPFDSIATINTAGTRTDEFVAPQPYSKELFISHTPYTEISSGKPFIISAKVAGLDASDKISLEMRAIPRWRTIPLRKKSAGEYIAEIPADAVTPGILNYRIIVQKVNNEYYVFPGNHKGDPYAWDNANNDTWQTIIADDKSGLEIFNTDTDRANLIQYNPDWRNNTFRFVPSDKTSQLATTITAKNLTDKQVMGWQFYFGDKLKGRQSELSSFTTLVIRGRAENNITAKIAMIANDALCFSANITAGSEWQDIKIPFSSLQLDSCLLLPRPYPGFLPLWFRADATGNFNLQNAEKLQVVCYGDGKPADLEIASAWLEK